MLNVIPNARTFAADTRGSITLFVLMTFLTLLLFVGAGIDMIRYEAERTRLQACIDNAVLAAASLDQGINDPQTIITDYMDTPGCKDAKGSDSAQIVSSETTILLGDRKISAIADASVPMFFLPLAGIDSLDYKVRSAAIEAEPNLEISLILDVSGSMGEATTDGITKLGALQDGAKFFINEVINDNSVGTGKIGISIVPYNRQVAMGDDMKRAIFGSVDPVLSNCVNFDRSAFGSLKLPTLNAGEIEPQWTYYGSEMTGYSITPTEDDCRPEGLGRMTLMSDNKQDLNAAIDGLIANGSTSIHYGAKWGFGLLDPTSQGLINQMITTGTGKEKVASHFSGRPFEYADVDGDGVLSHTTLKVAILMTDGENTSKWTLKDKYKTLDGETGAFWNDTPSFGTPNLVYDEAFRTGDLTQWRELGWAELFSKTAVNTYAAQRGLSLTSFFDTPTAKTQDNRTLGLCNKARQNGILVFSIAYAATDNGKTLMEACATSPDKYIVADPGSIKREFGKILTNLVKLKLTE